MLTPAIRSDIRNLVRRLEARQVPTNTHGCWAMECRYGDCVGGEPLCTMRKGLAATGRSCPLYRREGE